MSCVGLGQERRHMSKKNFTMERILKVETVANVIKAKILSWESTLELLSALNLYFILTDSEMMAVCNFSFICCTALNYDLVALYCFLVLPRLKECNYQMVLIGRIIVTLQH